MNVKGITVMKVVRVVLVTIVTMASTLPVDGNELADVLAGSFVGLKRLTISGNVPVPLTCNFNVSLSKPLIWKDSDDHPLNSSSYVNDFKSTDQEHRHVSFTVAPNKSHIYVMCIDPITSNVIRGFQIQHTDGFELISKKKITDCAIDPGFWTILNCQDMYIPPVVVESCYWTSQMQPNDQKGDPVQVLSLGGLFMEHEGWYACDCEKGSGHELIMNFTVHTSKNDERDTVNYQFCQHVTKLNKSSEQCHNDTSSTDALGGQGTSKYPQPAAEAFLGFMIVFLLVSVALGIVLFLRRRR